MNAEFYKESYSSELDLKEKLNTAISPPLTVITVLGGVLAFFAHNYTFEQNCVSIWFLISATLFALTLGFAIYCILQATTGYAYQRISAGPELREWHNTLLKHYEGRPNAQTLADAEFTRGLTDRYLEATKVNAKNNLSKSAHLMLANRALACAAALAMLASVPYFIHFYQARTPPTRVEIINLPSNR
ncbi:MAG TPA: hypothetical protein VF345_08910 [Chthoniobacterales bacterium]